MAEFIVKGWFRVQISTYLTKIKTWVNSLVSALQGQLDTHTAQIASLSSITGAFKSAFDTYAELPTGAGVRNGDWAILRIDDIGTGTAAAPQYESGFYAKQAGGWVFIMDLQSFDEIRETVLATPAEATAGTSSLKSLTVSQTVAKIAEGLASIDVSGKADLAGSASQVFSVAPANEDTNQAVNANQFTNITPAEAQADFDAS